MRYYPRFKDLSDKNLIHRVENKEKFQKEAVLVAFKILEERGYQLENPYPGEDIDFSFNTDRNRADPINLKIQSFVRSIKKESLLKVLIFLPLFYFIVYLNNFYVVSSEVVGSFYLLINTVIAKGTISNMIGLSLYALFFLLSSKSIDQLSGLTWNKAFVAIKVFSFTLLVLTFFEVAFRYQVTVFNIFNDNSPLSFTRNTIRIIGIGISEELVFKWLLLIQLLKRVELNSRNRVGIYLIVSILFALAHIPRQLADFGYINYFHLLQTSIFSYFTCTLFIRHQNFLLVVLLHVLCDLPTVYLDESTSKLFGTSLFLIPIYSLPFVSHSWLFKPNKNNSIVPLKKLAYVMVAFVVIALFLPKSEYDYYFISNENYRMQRDSVALAGASLAINQWGKG